MKRIFCEMCGSHELVKEDGLFVCPYCGCKYTLEEARKMMIEGNVDVSGSTVKVDDSKELENLYQLARRAKDDCNYEDAVEYYEQILLKDPNSWEAYFYPLYCSAFSTNLNNFYSRVIAINNSYNTLFNLIENTIPESSDRFDAHLRVINDCRYCLGELMKFSDSRYTPEKDKKLSLSVRNLRTLNYGSRTYAIAVTTRRFANYVEAVAKSYDENGMSEVVRLHKEAIKLANVICKLPYIKDTSDVPTFPTREECIELVDYCTEKIRKYETNFEPKRPSACYVATAVYGSYDCPQVWTLRRFRDYTLAESIFGRAFIKTYYAISPTVVKYFGDTVWFNKLFRGILNKMVAKLNETGVEDTPYEDRVW